MDLELNEYCPCCGYNTFNPNDRLSYRICKICFWEDDPIQFKRINETGANKVSLVEARKNFENFGACELEMKIYTRKITNEDVRDPNYFNRK